MDNQETKPGNTTSLTGLAKSAFNHVAKAGISIGFGVAVAFASSAYLFPPEGIEILNTTLQNVNASLLSGSLAGIGIATYLYKFLGNNAENNSPAEYTHLPDLTDSITRGDKIVGGLSATCNGATAFVLSGAFAAIATGNELVGAIGVPIGIYTAIRNYKRATIGGPAARAATSAESTSSTPSPD